MPIVDQEIINAVTEQQFNSVVDKHILGFEKTAFPRFHPQCQERSSGPCLKDDRAIYKVDLEIYNQVDAGCVSSQNFAMICPEHNSGNRRLIGPAV